MTKINWAEKLTSRKFWVAVVGFVTPLLISFGYSDHVVTEVASIIMAGASLIAYIIGEGLVDASRISTSNATATEGEQSNEEKEK